MLYHKTTKEHFEKFQAMVEKTGLTLRYSENPFGYTKQELIKLYQKDNLFNNIPLHTFDNSYYFLTLKEKKQVDCLADNCCLWKHILIYEVLKATPLFLEE